MPFVKLDCGILDSTLWIERECRELFLTSLLMAEPFELAEPTPQIAVQSLELTGWIVPAGWYGFVPAAGVGVIRRAGVPEDVGFLALHKLGEPDLTSRSPEHDGRRLVRIDGGFIVLNYIKYRERDYTSAERSKRYRARVASRRVKPASHRDITQAEEEVEVQEERNNKLPVTTKTSPVAVDREFQAFRDAYPNARRKGGYLAQHAFVSAIELAGGIQPLLAALENHKASAQWANPKHIPGMDVWLREERWRQQLPTVAETPSDATRRLPKWAQ